MGKTLSPLRYPGGKTQIAKNVQRIIEDNNYGDKIYVEPFAGGFGVGLFLLNNNIVNKAVINDSDLHVFHFWESVLYHTDELIALVEATPISLQERSNQKEIYSSPNSTILQDGFATLYLNRVNYSGVLFAGPLGGNTQTSAYHLGCRFNKDNLIGRIRKVAALSDRIQVYNLDAGELITQELVQLNTRAFYNMDPPYVKKGKSLYNEFFNEEEHRVFGELVKEFLLNTPWLITYDNCDLVREIYGKYHIHEFELYHSAHNRIKGNELIITNLSDDKFKW